MVDFDLFAALAGGLDGGTVAVDDRGEVEVAAPGVLGKNWGAMTPVGFIMRHAVYGLVLAVVYSAVA